MTDYEQWRTNFKGVPHEQQMGTLLEFVIQTNQRLDEVYKALPELATQCSTAINSLGSQASAALNDLAFRVQALEGPPKPDPDAPRLILP